MATKEKTGGRVKGTPNKLTSTALENVIAVFNRLDGTAGMAKWALANQSAFYAIYSKLLPSKIEQTTEHSGAVKHTVTLTIVEPSKPSFPKPQH
jgi:hypothetical protein